MGGQGERRRLETGSQRSVKERKLNSATLFTAHSVRCNGQRGAGRLWRGPTHYGSDCIGLTHGDGG